MKYFSLAIIQVVCLFTFSSFAHAEIPTDYMAMRQCQNSGAASIDPINFIDLLRLRTDVSSKLKEACIEFVLVKNSYIEVSKEDIPKLVKALVSAENNNIKSLQIFKIVTGR